MKRSWVETFHIERKTSFRRTSPSHTLFQCRVQIPFFPGYTQPLVLFYIRGGGSIFPKSAPPPQTSLPPHSTFSKEERGKERTRLTFSSIQALNACSTSPHLVALNPDDAQHPSTDDITVRHGLASLLPGLRIFNLRSGGSRIAGVLPVVSGITVEREGVLRERESGFLGSLRRELKKEIKVRCFIGNSSWSIGIEMGSGKMRLRVVALICLVGWMGSCEIFCAFANEAQIHGGD